MSFAEAKRDLEDEARAPSSGSAAPDNLGSSAFSNNQAKASTPGDTPTSNNKFNAPKRGGGPHLILKKAAPQVVESVARQPTTAALLAELQEAQAQLKAKDNKIAALQAQLSASEEARALLLAEAKPREEQISFLVDQVRVERDKAEDLELQETMQRGRAEAAEDDLKDTRSRLERQTEQLRQMEGQLADLEAQLASLDTDDSNEMIERTLGDLINASDETRSDNQDYLSESIQEHDTSLDDLVDEETGGALASYSIRDLIRRADLHKPWMSGRVLTENANVPDEISIDDIERELDVTTPPSEAESKGVDALREDWDVKDWDTYRELVACVKEIQEGMYNESCMQRFALPGMLQF